MKTIRFLLLQMILILPLLTVYGCSDSNLSPAGDQKEFTPSVLTGNKLMQYFAGNHPGETILKYAEADLDNNGQKDLIVIYRQATGQNRMTVICCSKLNVEETNAVPAPVADQTIQFKDIDKKPPLEFILQGRKGAKVGYAIFRVENGKLTDLFGEGMEDCC